MTSLLSARKRAEEFAAAVDGGADRSALRPELAELVGVVGTLQREAQAGAPPTPHPEFTAELRERLMAEAATTFASDNILALPPRRKDRRERRIALVASSLVLVGGTAGMAAAAQNALPGEALYPIKRGLENAQAGLATSQAARGQDLLEQADSRLVEVRGLFDSSGSSLSQVPATIDDFTRQALEASDVIVDEYETNGDDALIEELRNFAKDNLDELRELAKTAPPEHQDELAMAADALMRIDERAAQACPSCASELRALKMPALFLTANEAREALAAMERVQLDNSHPMMTPEGKAKPADQDKGPAGDDGKEPAPKDDDTGDTGDDDTLSGVPTGEVDTKGPSGGKGIGEIVEDTTGGLVDSVTGATGDTAGGTGDSGSGSDGGTGGTDGKKKDDGTKDVLPEELDPVVETILP